MTTRYLTLFAMVGVLSGCGLASVSPVVTDADLIDEPRLIGQWKEPTSRESVVITAAGARRYRLIYTEQDGKRGEFDARLGRLGSYRVLDLQPVEPIPGASDVYRSLLLRAHGLLVIDSVGTVIQARLVSADSVRSYLKRNPNAVAHTMVDKSVLITAASPEVQRFLQEFLGRAGVLDEPTIWQRSKP